MNQKGTIAGMVASGILVASSIYHGGYSHGRAVELERQPPMVRLRELEKELDGFDSRSGRQTLEMSLNDQAYSSRFLQIKEEYDKLTKGDNLRQLREEVNTNRKWSGLSSAGGGVGAAWFLAFLSRYLRNKKK